MKTVICEVFEKKFGEGFEYNADDAADMGTDVCTEIQDRVKGNSVASDPANELISGCVIAVQN